MTSRLDQTRCAVLPGEGVVGRWPGGLIVVVGGRELLDRFLGAVEVGDLELEPLVERARVLDWTAEGGGYLALIDRADGLNVEGAGDCDLVLGDRRVPAAEAPPVLADPSLVLAVLDRRKGVPATESGLDRALSFDRGLVPGAGVRLVSTWVATSMPTPMMESPPISPPTRPHDAVIVPDPADPTAMGHLPSAGSPPTDEPVAAPSPGDAPAPSVPAAAASAAPSPGDAPAPAAASPSKPFEIFTITEPLEVKPEPLPVSAQSFGQDTEEPAELSKHVVVQGIKCPQDHFNHPRALICVTCGVSTEDGSLELVRGFRPILGYLVIDDGTTYQLNQNYVIGRLVSADEGYVPIALGDDGISRRHARIELHGWDVALIDAGSMNGTRYQSPDSETWLEAVPDRPVVLQPGARVDLGGRRTFTFEAVYRLSSVSNT